MLNTQDSKLRQIKSSRGGLVVELSLHKRRDSSFIYLPNVSGHTRKINSFIWFSIYLVVWSEIFGHPIFIFSVIWFWSNVSNSNIRGPQTILPSTRKELLWSFVNKETLIPNNSVLILGACNLSKKKTEPLVLLLSLGFGLFMMAEFFSPFFFLRGTCFR